ncbi:hypothetical protein N7497_005930 [Penicillium chrysogenum]|uniref:Uncharacterized protein n=1 Tax=Penicillium chrysogenum TaxID=5076 RepID=A0ABQ8WRL4_PENCH|nr:hypothetical protein N7505_003863 [Penicillium chrysogenum]KAJ6157045.1 hypothetical protein N7497_005930 [Penicillium chrysogenum]
MHDSNHSFDAVRWLCDVRASRTEDSVHYWYGRCPQLQKECNSDWSKTPQRFTGPLGQRCTPPAAFPVVGLARLPAKAPSPKSDTDSEGDDDESEASESSEDMGWMKPAVEDWT